jgi:hypothetical protein
MGVSYVAQPGKNPESSILVWDCRHELLCSALLFILKSFLLTFGSPLHPHPCATSCLEGSYFYHFLGIHILLLKCSLTLFLKNSTPYL